MVSLKVFCRCRVGLLFIAVGLNHFWRTAFYVAMMPLQKVVMDWATWATRPGAPGGLR